MGVGGKKIRCLVWFCFFVVLANPPAFSDTSFHGYITNKTFNPLKLKVFEVDKELSSFLERNLENNSFVPILDLKISCENTFDYSLVFGESNIFVPELTKFVGYISEIEPSKSFDRKGLYKVTFDKAICPDGQTIYLKSKTTSTSESTNYNPFHHIGKTAFGLLGGTLAGSLASLQLGGLGLAAATHGYSIAAGGIVGGFIGSVGGVASKGKDASIEPGDELSLTPIDDVSLEELKQITCKKPEVKEITNNAKEVYVEILSTKTQKDSFGDSAIKINIRFENNSKDVYRLSNFFLVDSQGKEYSTTFLDANDDLFIDFPPRASKTAILQFVVDYPKASHWLVLKDKTFSLELGRWKIEKGS